MNPAAWNPAVWYAVFIAGVAALATALAWHYDGRQPRGRHAPRPLSPHDRKTVALFRDLNAERLVGLPERAAPRHAAPAAIWTKTITIGRTLSAPVFRPAAPDDTRDDLPAIPHATRTWDGTVQQVLDRIQAEVSK